MPSLHTSPIVPHTSTTERLTHRGLAASEIVRPIAPSIEPESRAARAVEPEPDYRSPSPRERARLLRAAYDASAADAEQHLLLAELMAHYRSWCMRNGQGDPFEELSAVASRAD